MKRPRPLTLILGVALASTAGTALAQLPLGASVNPEELADLRGGFIMGNGMHIDFSLHNLVKVNGETIIETIIAPGLAGMPVSTGGAGSSGAGGGLGSSPNVGMVIENSGLHTYVQNTLDDQVIQNMKILDIRLSKLPNLGTLNLQRQLDRTLSHSLR